MDLNKLLVKHILSLTENSLGLSSARLFGLSSASNILGDPYHGGYLTLLL
jgi:hypothetical protein